MKYTSQRGTKDILPSETPVWQRIEASCRRIFGLYNYAEIRTPVFEQTELFSRSIGTDTDIVSKEMYTFEDRGGRSLTLRPEETAPVVRACLQHNLISPENITKLWYMGPMFRYERPQAGRYRQFHQAGVEAFGSTDPMLDVEVIDMAVQLFREIGLTDLEVDINSVGCKKCRPEFIKKLTKYFTDKTSDLCDDCKKRLVKNPLRVLDCKIQGCQSIIKAAPAPVDSLCRECEEHFENVVACMDEQKIKYKINNRLVRGLDYYTGTTFEVVSDKLGAQNAVCGGGRYDDLVKELGGKPVPAVGFAIGLERLVGIIGSDVQSPKSDVVDVYLIAIGEKAKNIAFDLASGIRKAGFSADMDFHGKKLKSQLKLADRIGARFVLILGEDELNKGKIVFRDMSEGKQEEIKCDAATIVEVLEKNK
ncbi:MAG: histidine--tRNA ligase [Candidatus Margulisbacteria bacterium]|nr:histidine--tRNA ligase [Candidatus Margulisiibacteriota bacterium]